MVYFSRGDFLKRVEVPFLWNSYKPSLGNFTVRRIIQNSVYLKYPVTFFFLNLTLTVIKKQPINNYPLITWPLQQVLTLHNNELHLFITWYFPNYFFSMLLPTFVYIILILYTNKDGKKIVCIHLRTVLPQT